ncbi:TIGR02530 family flagellar biosynthesis protein [Marinicrinis sediminis]|uniref:TIGR02530 family flagellar biosynthesis protein n=1 Tax=Marinicrinis sediminis TaxID=1652465 RepID=A0ABW5R563_9BACL
MADGVKVGSLYTQTPIPIRPHQQQGKGASTSLNSQDSFQQVLNQKLLKFSHHAEMRLAQRGIRIQPEQWTKLEQAVQKAAGKGAKDTLLLMNNLAFIVNVKSNTVVTAMDQQSLQDHVFTQIDSAVVVR